MKTLDQRIAEVDQAIAQCKDQLERIQVAQQQVSTNLVATQGQKGLLMAMKQEAEDSKADAKEARKKKQQDEPPSA